MHLAILRKFNCILLRAGLCITLSAAGAEAVRHAFSIGTNEFLLDGKPLYEVHAPRAPSDAAVRRDPTRCQLGLACDSVPDGYSARRKNTARLEVSKGAITTLV